MSEESEKDRLDLERKVIMEGSSNFQFHAAYLAYSEAYDRASDPDVRKYLNQNIIALQQNKIDYQTFYRNINQYRSISTAQYHSKSSIKTQSKGEWRSKMRKIEREKRYER
ncbi:hypothetical protein KEJ34_06635 [Candidatus Bathyarchaeota archaeon]|nr:hypothetical protein [Candidatus Bathyarchaeota archaeon]